jgi:transposase
MCLSLRDNLRLNRRPMYECRCVFLRCDERSPKNFLEEFITTKYKNKLIILDNASSHRNERIRELINKHNHVLYAVPYQHFTNAIENFFSVFKSKLQKKVGITYQELKHNIKETVKDIPSEILYRIF